MPDRPGVLRILRARVKSGREEAWLRLVNDQIDAQVAQTAGVLGWYVGRPVDDERPEFVVVSLWRDMEAVRAFAGASGHATPLQDPEHLTEHVVVELYELAH